mmetsp:Transcript_43271/g.119653  ORF Transcript_43271/g.119653 Transcript_43271/m.119653 type:complete len:213 (+) Transcript_43271:122-760(+)
MSPPSPLPRAASFAVAVAISAASALTVAPAVAVTIAVSISLSVCSAPFCAFTTAVSTALFRLALRTVFRGVLLALRAVLFALRAVLLALRAVLLALRAVFLCPGEIPHVRAQLLGLCPGLQVGLVQVRVQVRLVVGGVVRVAPYPAHVADLVALGHVAISRLHCAHLVCDLSGRLNRGFASGDITLLRQVLRLLQRQIGFLLHPGELLLDVI